MDKMQSKQHTLREETLTPNTLNCVVCPKKHPINHLFKQTSNPTHIQNFIDVCLVI